ncbi:MFS transporter [Vibrio paucivorans]|uniref:MFS transporter n=1 Tax=Vibrio paucivorans TaxID=2829489 RepID=A0A9X3CCN2_9VIBR|nr:MFS transporter [Vibrio paucivorans]MCW8332975.1 MFS transporter [Vibrio paucivorans]
MDLVNNDKRKFSFSLRAKLSFAILSVLLFSISLNTVLNYLNFEKRIVQTSDSIYDIVLEETENDINQAISLGLPLSAISNIQALLDRRISLAPGITSISVEAANGVVLFQATTQESESDRELTSTITNTFGVVEGRLKLHYSIDQLEKQTAFILNMQLFYALFSVLVASICGFIFLKVLLAGISNRVKKADSILASSENVTVETLQDAHRALSFSQSKSKWNQKREKHFPLFVIVLAIVLTISANVASSYLSLNKFSQLYELKLEQKSNLIGDALTTMVDRLLSQGVPIDRLQGLEEEFAFYTEGHEEITAIALSNEDAHLYHYPETTGDLSNASHIEVGSRSQIHLNISTDENILLKMLKESLMDMLTVLVASCLVVSEIILFMCNFMIISPWHQVKKVFMTINRDIVSHVAKVTSRDEIGQLLERANSAIVKLNPEQETKLIESQDYRFIRLPLFMLVFAEAASLAFFPNYVASLENSYGWIPENLVTSLPISLFMLCWALSLPFAGYWSDKVGRRHSLMVGGIITGLGLFGTAITQSLEILLVTRAITAVGYGIVFISAQGYVSDTTNDNSRTKGMATFLSSFFSGSLCGAAIGGILADKLGYSATFIFAGLLAFASVALVSVFFERTNVNNNSQPVKLSDFSILLSNKYFALITICSAIPAKIVLTGFLYYICPVYLQFLGESSAASGRVMMAYGLAIIVISPISAILVDKFNNKIAFIFIGGLISALALLNIYFVQGTLGILMIVIFIGIAHGVCVSPQIPLVIELLSSQGINRGKVIGIFRLTERIGNIAGPMLAGLALSVFGYNFTIMLFGGALLASSLALLLFFFTFTRLDQKSLEVSS